MTKLRLIRRNEQGATAVEAALGLPVLLAFIYGIYLLGVIFYANAGIQHALGEGARFGTIWPRPTSTQVQTRVTSKLFGTASANTGYPTVTATPDNTTNPTYYTVTVTYQKSIKFLFLPSRNITFSRSKIVYLAT